MTKKRRRRKDEWESLCHQCGLCCYEKDFRKGRGIVDLNRPCPFLDEHTMRCTVYTNRFKKCKQCAKVTIFHAMFSSFMPETCGYVQRYRRWKVFRPALVRGTPAAERKRR